MEVSWIIKMQPQSILKKKWTRTFDFYKINRNPKAFKQTLSHQSFPKKQKSIYWAQTWGNTASIREGVVSESRKRCEGGTTPPAQWHCSLTLSDVTLSVGGPVVLAPIVMTQYVYCAFMTDEVCLMWGDCVFPRSVTRALWTRWYDATRPFSCFVFWPHCWR